uniref:SH3 and SYLF domain containing 1 n=1 Tax=Callorhinchus milii TaxID=7868 RepID=A0A4W3IIB7_CALMI
MNPIPSNLKSESKKAANILREFTEITSRNGPDKIIPAHVIAKAQGLAILSVIKAGFLVTALGAALRVSVVGDVGIGIEVSDFVIILNHKRAVEAFAKGGNLILGGDFTVAIRTLGRNMEAKCCSAQYSCKGSCLIERAETNGKFYCQGIRVCAILFGDLELPSVAQERYEILASFSEHYQIAEQRNKIKNISRMQPKTDLQFDWWEGNVRGKVGIFPANCLSLSKY